MVTARVTAQLTARWTARLNVDAAAAWSGLMRVRVSCSRVIREPLKERQAVHIVQPGPLPQVRCPSSST